MAATGDRFGHWTVQSTYLKRRGSKNRQRSICLCICGKLRHVWTDSLMGGESKSCGCKRRGALTHGATAGGKPNPEYIAWQRMKQRCYYPQTLDFERWGGRGITVCDRWKNSFEAFLDDMGSKPAPRYSVERRDNDGHYEPNNCYWASPKEQARNTRRNRHITFDNQTMNVAEWADTTGLPSQVIRDRLDKSGWSIEKTLTTPSRGKYWGADS